MAASSFLVSIPKSSFDRLQLLQAAEPLTAETGSPQNFDHNDPSSPRVKGSCTSFHIPPLLVGTLNTLMSLSDDLVKLDSACKVVVSAIERQGKEIHQLRYDSKSLDNWAMVNNNRTMSQYFRGFEWAEQKFPKGYPLPELCTLIKTKVGKMEEDLKHFQSNYAEQKSAKQAAERSKRGNWQGMELGELLEVQSNAPDSKPTRVEATGKPLSSSDFLDTQFMKTLVAVVPSSARADFEANYSTIGNPADDVTEDATSESDRLLQGGEEKLADASNLSTLPCSPVVPGSLLLVKQNNDSVLYLMTVVKSQKVIGQSGATDSWAISDSFYKACKRKRVTVRDFDWDPVKAADKRLQAAQLDADFDHYEVKTLDWCRVHYGEAVIAWAHVKAVRVFVESVLRYGLPPEFETVLLTPQHGKDKKLRAVLERLYGHLDESGSVDDGSGGGGGPNMDGAMGLGEYYPYVNIDF